MSKICSQCKLKKPVSEFYKDSSHADGLTSQCKLCKYAPSNSKHGNTKAKQQFKTELAAEGVRVCSTCGNPGFIESDFYGDEHRCKKCCIKRASIYAREVKTGWTEEEYLQAFAAQEGKCAICKEASSESRMLAADHCHLSGRKGKLLCSECNLILGKAHDNPKILRAAADYLEMVRTDA